MKNLIPEMDIVEFDESVLTMDVTGNSSTGNQEIPGSSINGHLDAENIQ